MTYSAFKSHYIFLMPYLVMKIQKHVTFNKLRIVLLSFLKDELRDNNAFSVNPKLSC